MMNIERIDNEEAFENLRPQWNTLLAASASNCLFLTWEWLHTWWQHFREQRQLAIVVLREGRDLAGVAPFCVRRAEMRRLVPFRALEFLATGTIGSDYLDVVALRGREAQVVDALAGYVQDQKLTLELGQLAAGSSLAANLARRLATEDWSYVEFDTNVCPFINLKGQDWESYLAGLGSEHRYAFQRKMRKLAKDFEARFEWAADESQRRIALNALLDLHRLRWTGRDVASDAFHTPAHVGFHHEFTRLALREGWLRLLVLWLDGKPAAALYGFLYGSKFYFFQSGFDPAYSKHSVGLVTMGVAIRSAIEQDAVEYDLLHGDEAYKSHWARQSRRLIRLELYPPGAGGLACRTAAGFGRSARRMARKLLHSTAEDKQASGTMAVPGNASHAA